MSCLELTDDARGVGLGDGVVRGGDGVEMGVGAAGCGGIGFAECAIVVESV